jgi:hypothetical protein
MVAKRELRSVAGTFWLAGDVKRKRDGFLDLEARFPTLRLVGGYGGSGAFGDVVFHGRLATHRPREVTLFNCFGTTTSVGAREAETHIESTLAAIGGHFMNVEALIGVGIEFRLGKIASWFHRKAFDFEGPDQHGWATVRYKTHEEVAFPITQELSLTAVYQAPFFVGGWGSEQVNIARTLRLRLSGAARTYKEWRDTSKQCRDLFALLINDDLDITEIEVLEKPTARDATRKKRLAVIESSTQALEDRRDDPRPEYLLSYINLEARFPKLVSDWFRMYETHGDSMESFFAGFGKRSQPPTWAFLSSITAIEEMHRGSTGYKNTKLRRRIVELVERWKQLIQAPPDDKVLDQIVASRDYYSHRNQAGRAQSAHGFLLLRYTYFLRALYTLELFAALDFHPVEVLQLVEANYELRESVNLRAFPDALNRTNISMTSGPDRKP